jgi:hypothetical protein
MGSSKSKPESDNGRLKGHIEMLRAAEAGHLDDLDCPGCCKPAVSVWFSNPVPGEYRTWFLCSECTFHTRAQNTDKPAFFLIERCRTDLEARDKAVLDIARFKPPTH